MSDSVLLRLRDVSCGYGSGDIVKNASLTVASGERVCITGPNGCGKTTLLRAVTGSLPYRGSIELVGAEVRSLRPRERARRLSVVSQSIGGGFPYTVRESVAFGRYSHGTALRRSPDDAQKIAEALSVFGLTDMADVLTDRLSGGQAQRVALARAYAQDAPLMLLDEPTSHLDLKCQLELTAALAERATAGCGVLAVLHDLTLARRFATKPVLMADGCIIAAGAPEEVFTQELLGQCFGGDVVQYLRQSAHVFRDL